MKPLRLLLLLAVAAASVGSCATASSDGSSDGGSGGTSSQGSAGTQGWGGATAGNGGAATAGSGGGGAAGTAGTGAVGTGGDTGGNAGGSNGGGGVGGAGAATGLGGGAAGAGAGSAGTGGAAGGGRGGSAGSGGGGGTAGSGAGGRGGAGGTPAAGTGGGGSIGGMGGVRMPVQVASSVPSQYRNAVANPGKWTRKMYPVYYYTTQSGGSASQTGPIPKQSQSITKPCNVYTPPGYDPQIEYPLIFVFHGITDNENTWMERGDPKPNILLDNLITSNVIKPVVAVFPQGNSKPDFATDKSYTNTAGYYVFGNELMNDLVPFIEANYSVKKDRSSRAVSGFSMGGMQTINIGLCQNLKSFGWFGAFSPAGGNFSSSQIAQYLQMEDAASYPVNYFYVVVGQSDTTAGASADASTNGLTTKTPYITSTNFTYHKVDGGHVYPIATIGLYNILRIAFGN
jgi:enterochelin esterase-like enzyme